MQCPVCKAAVFRPSGDGRMKAKVSVLVLRKGEGSEVEVETNCSNCRSPILLPLVLASGSVEIRKAATPRLIVRRA